MALARPDWGSAATEYPADKGLNCAENIFHALKNGDGYIFSKSVKQLPEIERTWVLLSNDYRDIKDDNGDVLYRIKECVDEFESINEQLSKNAQSYPTNSKTSSSVAPFLMN